MANEMNARPRSYAPFGTAIDAAKAEPGLYLVATPIGNLGDITLRALEVLAGADVIACEDTRVTRKLIERYGITTPLTAYHEHNAAEARPKLLARLADDQAIALVSDAGTPLISDPGYKLVRAACEAGHCCDAPFRVPHRCWPRFRSLACRPIDFSSRAFLPPKAGGAPKTRRRSSRISRQRWLCSRVDLASCGNARRPCRGVREPARPRSAAS